MHRPSVSRGGPAGDSSPFHDFEDKDEPYSIALTVTLTDSAGKEIVFGYSVNALKADGLTW